MMLTGSSKACRIGVATSWCRKLRIEDSVCKSVSKACCLGTIASAWKQQKTECCVNRALHHPAHSMSSDLFSPRTLGTGVHFPHDSHVKWRFPADDRVRETFLKVHHGLLSQTVIITLNAALPITEELMEEALNILYDKCESLRISFRFRQNALWVADMLTRRLDFKSVSGDDVGKHISDLCSSPFDIHNGPLWKARLMTFSPEAPCHFPEVKEKFPHQYNLLLSFHHAANDGRVLMVVVESILTILDHLLQGLPVDRRQVGILRDRLEARKEESRIKAALENDPVRLKAALRELKLVPHVPLLVEAFGEVSEARSSTDLLPPVQFDAEVLKSVAYKCRSLGVSTNTFMTAVLNTTLVEVVREAGLKRNNYLISGMHLVDSRRLMGKTSKLVLGFHGLPMIQTTATPHNVKDCFWGYLKNLNTEFKGKLKRNYMCEERVLHAMLRSQDDDQEAQYTQPQPLSHDYMLSNVYSSFAAPKETGTVAHVTSLSFHVTFHKLSFPVAFGFFGVRGKPLLEMSYSTATINKKVARRFLDKFVVVLHDISKASSL